MFSHCQLHVRVQTATSGSELAMVLKSQLDLVLLRLAALGASKESLLNSILSYSDGSGMTFGE